MLRTAWFLALGLLLAAPPVAAQGPHHRTAPSALQREAPIQAPAPSSSYAEGVRERASRFAFRAAPKVAAPAWYRAAAAGQGAAPAITVNTLAGDDDGTCGTDAADPIADCSLLEAAALANAAAGADVIRFAVAGVIPVQAPVLIESPVRVAGSSAPGGPHQVRIDASATFEGFLVSGAAASQSTIEGLVIGGAIFDAVVIVGDFDGAPSGVRVQNNYIGTDPAGAWLGNGGTGIVVLAPDNTIGGAAPGQGNTIANNAAWGIAAFSTDASGTVVQGNYIGTDAASRPLGNGAEGIILNSGDGMVIGGVAPGAGNTIAFNGGGGLRIEAASGAVVQGNRIGTDAAGGALGNGGVGVFIVDASGCQVGGVAPGAGNTVGGSAGSGIIVLGSFEEASGNVVEGNYVGTDAAGRALGNSGNGVSVFNASGNTVGGTHPRSGNTIGHNARYGVLVASSGLAATGNVVQGNHVGTDAAGRALGNGFGGVGVLDASDNTVGGSHPHAGNTVGNSGFVNVASASFGLGAADNVIQGNYIGTDAEGRALGSRYGVIVQDATANLVGGAGRGEGNTIGFSEEHGIDVIALTEFAGGHTIQGNYIGTDAEGRALGNGGNGIQVADASGNQIGGAAPGAGNTIGHSGLSGLFVVTFLDVPMENAVEGNRVGTDAAGRAMGNGLNGVRLVNVSGTRVGGAAPGAGNTIAHNAASGVGVLGFDYGPWANPVLQNAIHDNGALGIDLEALGEALGDVTPNDGCGDADAGANGLQNYPVITSAARSGNRLAVAFDLDTAPGDYRVEFFAVDAPDASGHGEGRRFLGAEAVTVAPGCAGAFAAELEVAPPPTGGYVTATATPLDASQPSGFGGTSEFSAAISLEAGAALAGAPSGSAEGGAVDGTAPAALRDGVEAFALAAPYPNPARATAAIDFMLPEATSVRLTVFDAMGRAVARLADGPAEAGLHTATLDAAGLASGTYLVRLTTEAGFAASRRIAVVR